MMSPSVWLPGPMFLGGGRFFCLWLHVPSEGSLSSVVSGWGGLSLSERPPYGEEWAARILLEYFLVHISVNFVKKNIF